MKRRFRKSRLPGSKLRKSGRCVDNLLYLYTQPFDVVVDPSWGYYVVHGNELAPAVTVESGWVIYELSSVR